MVDYEGWRQNYACIFIAERYVRHSCLYCEIDDGAWNYGELCECLSKPPMKTQAATLHMVGCPSKSKPSEASYVVSIYNFDEDENATLDSEFTLAPADVACDLERENINQIVRLGLRGDDFGWKFREAPFGFRGNHKSYVSAFYSRVDAALSTKPRDAVGENAHVKSRTSKKSRRK